MIIVFIWILDKGDAIRSHDIDHPSSLINEPKRKIRKTKATPCVI